MTQAQPRADCSLKSSSSAAVLKEVTLLSHEMDQKLSTISEQDPTFQEIVQTRNALRYLRDTKLQRKPSKQAFVLDVNYLRHLAYSWRGYLTPICGWLQLLHSRRINIKKFLEVTGSLLRNADLQLQTIVDLEARIITLISPETTTVEEAKLLDKVDLFKRKSLKQTSVLDTSYLCHLAYSWRGYLTPIYGWLQLLHSRKTDIKKFLEVTGSLLRNIHLQLQAIADLETGIDVLINLESMTVEEVRLLEKVDLLIHS